MNPVSTAPSERREDVLPIDILKVDDSYQRPFKAALAKEIAFDDGGYDINAAGFIVVSERPPLPGMKDHRYYTVDGQHRAAAAKLVGETEVLCTVITFRGSETKIRMLEADLRGKFGTRKADTPIERFKHQLAAGNDESLAIANLVESYAGTVSLSANSSHGINAISALEEIYRKGALDDVCRIIKSGWDTFDARAGESASLKGIFWLVTKHDGEFDEARLTRVMRNMPPDVLLARAEQLRAMGGGSRWKNVYRALVEAYNHRQAEKKKLRTVEF